jgi:glucose-6-phosphate 1-epimerase
MIEFKQRAPGVTVALISNAAAKAEISLYGGQVLSYAPKGQKDLLFLSAESLFAPGKAIRGGIPVCFPWFGPHAKNKEFPTHGFARVSQWELGSVTETQDRSVIVLTLKDSAETKKLWPYAFKLSLSVSVGDTLDMSLCVANTGKSAFNVTDALHTYFNVKNIKSVSVLGMDRLSYIDRVGEKTTRKQSGPIAISGETDRVYLKPKSMEILDPGLKRKILIERKAFPDAVVWNPWVERAKAFADFGNEEYKRMICVEAAAVFDNAITVEPGKSATQKMSVTAAQA